MKTHRQLTLAFAFRLLGEQGARIGPLLPFPIDLHWVLVAAAIAFFLTPSSSTRPHSKQFLVVLVLLALAAWPLRSWRDRVLNPTPALVVEVSRASDPSHLVEQTLLLDSLDLDSRRYLHRLTGRRRDIALDIKGFLFVPESGEYGFSVDCDDACRFEIDETDLASPTETPSTATHLDAGAHRLTIHYQQGQGPAFLRIRWNRPASMELLRLEHYLSGQRSNLLDEARLQSRTWHAALSYLSALVWWAVFLGLILRTGETRTFWKQRFTSEPAARWVPRIAAVILIVYGALLRFDSLLVHSQLTSESQPATEIHQKIQPLLPNYSLFNPNNAPDDPYRADVRSYLDRSSTLSLGSFYDAHFREPFYVALVKLFVTASGAKELAILIQSTFFSIAILPLVYILAARLSNRWWALGILIPVTLHEWLLLEAPTGYRMSTYAFFLLLYVGWLFIGKVHRWWVDALIVGVLGAMVSLTRLSGLSLVLPLLLLKAWEKRKEGGWRYAGAAALTLAVLIGPFLLNCYRVHGDSFYAVSFNTHFWLETENHTESISTPVNLYRYLLNSRGLSELIKGSFLGLTFLPLRTFWNGLAHFPWLGAMVVATGIGGLALSLRSRMRFLAVAYFAHLIPFAYIQNFPSGEMPRFVMPAFFFFILAAAWACHRLQETRKRRSPSRSSQEYL